MTRSETLKLLACQIDVPETRTAEDRDRHLARLADRVAKPLDREPADLVVLPELGSIEYSRPAFDRLDAIAEPMRGASFETWRRIAMRFGVYVAFSFARSEAGRSYITLAVVGPDGEIVGHYDKIYLAQYGASMEKDYFTRGDDLFVFEVNDFKIGCAICADIRIPELSRTLTIEGGAEVLLHCGAYFRDESFDSWHDFIVTRAMENQSYVLSLNRAGVDWGNSLFCPPWVDEAHRPTRFPDHAEAFSNLTIKRSEIAFVREAYSFLKDRIQQHRITRGDDLPAYKQTLSSNSTLRGPSVRPQTG